MNHSADLDDYLSNLTNTSVIFLYDPIHDKVVQALFCVLYTSIFVLGLFGNGLVCYVVGRNRAMHTVTNCFITNLALSDILLCALAVPFTPMYTFLQRWAFGSALCHMVPYAQGTSVYISTLTLTSIAVDRFFVIIYPFKPRMKLTTCLSIIILIWVCSLLLTLPYGFYVTFYHVQDRFVCEENWPTSTLRGWYSGATTTLQFVIPFLVISFCYIRVSVKLNDRARSKPGSKNSRKEEADRERKRRTNRMLIAMVTIFGGSWLPLNFINVFNDLDEHLGAWEYYNLCFFFGHAIAMSSTCYNPILYAWLNDNFRKEFKQVLPCFSATGHSGSGRLGHYRSERTCNGNETCQETLLPTSVVIPSSKPSPPLANLIAESHESGDEPRSKRLKSNDSVEVVLVAFTAGEDTVQIDKLDAQSIHIV